MTRDAAGSSSTPTPPHTRAFNLHDSGYARSAAVPLQSLVAPFAKREASESPSAQIQRQPLGQQYWATDLAHVHQYRRQLPVNTSR